MGHLGSSPGFVSHSDKASQLNLQLKVHEESVPRIPSKLSSCKIKIENIAVSWKTLKP